MNLAGLDSATPPSGTQVQAARAAGIAVWSGYLATHPELGVGNAGSRFGLFRPWRQIEFGPVKALQGAPIAYASGWDDPVGCKALAAAWGVRLCLDVEAGIRDNGAWVQGWLDASGAGLYGGSGVHPGRRAAFHILSSYPTSGDPGGESWPSWLPTPAEPCGWQWAGSYSAFGVTVDSTWLDPWFGGKNMITQDEFNALVAGNPFLTDMAYRVLALITNSPTVAPQAPTAKGEVNQVRAAFDALKNAPAGTAPSYQGSIILTPK